MKSQKEIADCVLWQEMLAGQPEAFGTLYQRYRGKLMRYGRQLTTDKTLVEDGVHDVFLEVYRLRARINPNVPVLYYLMNALRHRLQRTLKIADRIALTDSTVLAYLGSWDSSCEDRLVEEEREVQVVSDINKAVQNLSNRRRQALEMRYWQGCSHTDIARNMGLSSQATYNLICSGTKQLRQELHNIFD